MSFRCFCPRGYKGKNCNDLKFCDLHHCPDGSKCKNLEDGFECVANITYDGHTSPTRYRSLISDNPLQSLDLSYRTKYTGVVLHVTHVENYFLIFVRRNEVVVHWSIADDYRNYSFEKDHFDGQWITLAIKIKDGTITGGFKEAVEDGTPNFVQNDFDMGSFSELFWKGVIYVGGADPQRNFTYDSSIKSTFNEVNHILQDVTTKTYNEQSLTSKWYSTSMELNEINKTMDNIQVSFFVV